MNEHSYLDAPGTNFFRRALEDFLSAEQVSNNPVEYCYLIGGYPVKLRFAGPALARYTAPILAHLAIPSHPEPALTICLWDSASTGARFLSPPWIDQQSRDRSQIRAEPTNVLRTLFNPQSGELSLLALDRKLALYWIPRAEDFPAWERAQPLLHLWHWWMSALGRQLVHAAAVGLRDGGVLLAGKGGSGKSSTALACLGAGMCYAADDYCLVSIEDTPFIHSLYNVGKLDVADRWRFPTLDTSRLDADPGVPDKDFYFLSEQFEEYVVTGFPLKAILLPKIVDQEQACLQPVSRAKALLHLAPSTIFQLAGGGPGDFLRISAIVRRTPCYILEIGRDLERLPDVLKNFLTGIG